MDPEDLDIADMSKNNMLQLLHFFEQAGIGLPRIEMFTIMLSMKELVKKEPIASIRSVKPKLAYLIKQIMSCRFWGKIYGTIRNYIVVETELKEEEYMKRNQVNLRCTY